MPEGDPPGRQSMVGENVYEVDAPPGKLVTVEYQDVKLTARRVRANYALRTLVAEGDVLLEQGKTRLRGSRLDLDLAQKVGVLSDGSIDLEGGLHLRAATLTKLGPRTFSLTDGWMSACDGESPAWDFRLKSGRVTLEEYARLKNVVFRLGGIPLLYTPYLLWPAKQDRASGLLIPGYGYSERRGLYLGLSYYWAFSRSGDATFSADLYSKGYFGFGGEIRLRPSAGTKIEGVAYTIYDPGSGEPGAFSSEAGWRWKTRGTVTADDLGPNLRGVVRWLEVSDQQFFQDFDRDFALVSTRSTKSEAFVTKNSGPLSFNLRLDREEALFGDTSVVTQRLPVVEARLRPYPLLDRHVYVEAEASGAFLKAERGSSQPSGSYDRFDLYPKVSFPLSSIPWLSLQADAGARVTSYGKSVDGARLVDERYTRTSYRAGAELTGPSFARLFDLSIGPYTRFKHVIEPRFSYSYQPAVDDVARTPIFDEIDSVPMGHQLRYALVQRFLGKGKSGPAREIASLEIARTYSFQLPPGSSPTQGKSSPWDATLRVNAGVGLNLDARVTYDQESSQLTSSSVTASVSAGDTTVGLSLFDSHPVVGEPSAQLRISGGTPLIGKTLRLDLAANYDVTLGKMLESRSLLTIQGSCWKILMEYRDLRVGVKPNRDYRIGLTLKSIGSFLDFTGSL